MSDFHRETPVLKTRKPHRCGWCHQRIEKGSPATVTQGVFEGDFYRGHYHPECNAAAKEWYRVNRCWGDPMPEDPMERGGIRGAGEVPITETTES